MEISESFRERVSKLKYARWAADLDEETLIVLCNFIGEFATRSYADDYGAHTYRERARIMKRFDPAWMRADVGLEVIYEIKNGLRFKDAEREMSERFDRGIIERSARASS
ncbi:hypothetical protein Rhal01_00251 [Rubritalea halochordaticola]|uniref:Uncharacterized protein n=1 Tax=Rubritalea halochordaticola TaxID=714537 RepID=A0ABP9UWL6_9BACT